MESMERYLIQIEDVLESSKTVPFSGKVAVDKELIYEIIDEIRLNLPNEIKESRKILDNKEKYLKEAEKRSVVAIESANLDAENIIKDAENKALRLTSDHEIYKRALDDAERILEESKRDAKNIRINAMDYADEVLSKAEHALKLTAENMSVQHKSVEEYYEKVLETLYDNRQELRGK